MFRRLLPLAVALSLVWPASAQAATTVPPVKHVVVIVLENKGYDETFGPSSQAPYIAKDLPSMGKLLTQYYATGHLSLDNYITMLSGQPPNPQTQADCQFYTEFAGVLGPDGIAIGNGCVYPASVKTLADQLDAKGLSWKGYMEDMGNDPARDNGTTCAHPVLNTRDGTQSAAANDQYASRHNPFVYFHSIIDRPECAKNVVPLTQFTNDLASASTLPAFSFITPNLCNDGHDGSGSVTGEKCANGDRGGLYQSGKFLEQWIPKILASPGYADDGMVIVTWDEAENSDASSCCNEPTGPNTPRPGINGNGGGRIGTIVLSKHVRAGTTSAVPYNHYSLLRTLEDLYGVPHLGYAAMDGLAPFGADVFDNVAGAPANPATPTPAPASGGRLPTTGQRAPLALGAAFVLAGLGVLGRRRRRGA